MFRRLKRRRKARKDKIVRQAMLAAEQMASSTTQAIIQQYEVKLNEAKEQPLIPATQEPEKSILFYYTTLVSAQKNRIPVGQQKKHLDKLVLELNKQL